MEVSFLSLKEKATQHWFSYYQIARKYKQSFMTNPLSIIFDAFSIRLLGHRTEFSCLYLPQEDKVIITV